MLELITILFGKGDGSDKLAVGSDLDSLTKKYIGNIEKNLELRTAIDDCLRHTRSNHEIIPSAVKCFGEDFRLEVMTDEKKFVKTLSELKRFKAAEKHFLEESLVPQGAIRGQQESMLGELRAQNERLDNALTVAIAPAWKWCDGRWKWNVEKVKQQKLTTRMKHNALLHTTTIHIMACVTNLEEKIRSLSKPIHVVLGEEYVLKVAMDDININSKAIRETIENLL
ncbi:hypothetical protein ES319_D03G017500v1 [Gossypium barbadense]|uniref:Uncharacterized protein n=1 Tax=Gossypium barbadense TaxID=3634 RepID=A0A5J5RZD9_GOSBA|nr:hypothetical protein ES319_D03G017500v1 [Gossypium barbadense]